MIEDGVKISELTEASSVSSNVVVPIVSGDETKKINVVDLIYPVGSIYMSVNSTSPATLFGGTWQQIKDTFLLSAGDTYTAGNTGGEATHTLTQAEIPNYVGTIRIKDDTAPSQGGSGDMLLYSWTDKWRSSVNNLFNELGGNAHNNMPPYLVVYMWKRTA